MHWIVWNIPFTNHLKENVTDVVEGINDLKKHHNGVTCLPNGLHGYFFIVYALTRVLELPDTADDFALKKAMSECTKDFGEMIGLYQRTSE